ncbi:hypothetical protein BGZ74_001629 [Mortierella antarctica]|nr:hypothetical protein BGZ74_001629 [Mortierella antarctica]
MEAQISVHADVPQNKRFYIKSKASGLVLDVDHVYVHAGILQHDGQYKFHIVQASKKELPWFFRSPSSNH